MGNETFAARTPDHLTVVVNRRIKSGHEAAFEQAMRSFVEFALSAPGHQGIIVLRPAPGRGDYTVVDQFSDERSRRELGCAIWPMSAALWPTPIRPRSGHRQISARAKEIYLAAGETLSDEDAHLERLSKAADDGDKLADKVWEDVGTKIGVGLTNVIWLVNPDRIVIGGGVAKAGERLFGYIRQTIAG